MGLINFIFEVLNREVVIQFNDLMNNHAAALRQWTSGRYTSSKILPASKLLSFNNAEAERLELAKLFKPRCIPSPEAFNYKQKKFIVERKDSILNLYNVYTYYQKVDLLFDSLQSIYPLALRFFAENHLGVLINDAGYNANLVSKCNGLVVTYSDLGLSTCPTASITTIANLSIEQKEKLISYKDKFATQQELINQKIKECEIRKEQELIHNKFVEKVLKNKRRKQWYCNFQIVKGNESEEYCIDHLLELDTYIANNLEQQYEEIKAEYPEGIKYYDLQNNFSEADHIEDVDYWEDCVRLKEKIKEQHCIALQFNTLYEKYPNGITGYQNAHQIIDDNLCSVFIPTKEDIVNLGEKKLAELENLHSEIKRNSVWIKEQVNYAQFSRNIHDEYLHNWGCYYYDLDVEYQTFSKEPSINKYRIWEHFNNSYCSEHDLDYTNFIKIKNEYNLTLPLLRELKAYHKNKTYDQIINYICKIRSNYGSVFVLFGDSSVRDEEFNNYHFEYFKEQLEKKEICYGSKLINADVAHLYKYIVIVEVISTNSHLQEQCLNIISAFKKETPYISYVSLEKEMDRMEMQKLISAKNAQLQVEKEQAELEKLKQLERVKKERERQIQEQIEKERYEQEVNHLYECVNNWYLPRRSSLKCFSMYNYYPINCNFEANEQEWAVRNLIWDFKANPNKPMSKFQIMHLHSQAAWKISEKMCMCLRHFFGDSICKLTLVCIPSSKQEVSKRRYEDFSNMICTNLAMENAYQHVRVTEDGEAAHLGGSVRAEFSIDADFFKGKNVLLFDDVITSGSSMESFKLRLERAGAKVIAGFSIGRTVHERIPYNPVENIDHSYHSSIDSCDNDDLPLF